MTHPRSFLDHLEDRHQADMARQTGIPFTSPLSPPSPVPNTGPGAQAGGGNNSAMEHQQFIAHLARAIQSMTKKGPAGPDEMTPQPPVVQSMNAQGPK